MTDEELQQIRSKHPDKKLHHFAAPTGEEVVVRRPDRGTWKRYQTQGQDDRKRGEALEVMLRSCLVHPDVAGFEAMLDDRPGLVQTFGMLLVDAAGASDKGEKKAL